jgi:hypothetical protein
VLPPLLPVGAPELGADICPAHSCPTAV